MIAFNEIIINNNNNNNSSSSFSEEESKKAWCGYTIMLIHGLLGCGNDFAEFAHSLASSLSSASHFSSDWRMVLVDLRNHGRSTDIGGLLPPHDLENAARDLSNLVKSHNWAWPDVVIGHSLGGKVALQYTLSCARGDYGGSTQPPKMLWVLDVNPGKIEHIGFSEELEKALHTLHTLPSPILSQEWLVDHMINLGFSKYLSEWIGNSLTKSGEHERLSFNAEGALQMFKSARIMDYWGLLEHPPVGTEIALVRTESQISWQPDVVERLDSLAKRETDESTGKFSVHVVPRSGHWVYRDQPETLLEIMTPKIVSLLLS